MNMHPLVKDELENLQIQFPNKSILTLDDYAVLYNTPRRNASRHLHRRGVPVTKEGKEIYISITELAYYRAKHKIGNNPLIEPMAKDEMKRRRGFCQMADKRELARRGG